MELQEIKRLTIELMDALKSRGLAEVSLDTEGFKIAIRANTPTSSIPAAGRHILCCAIAGGTALYRGGTECPERGYAFHYRSDENHE